MANDDNKTAAAHLAMKKRMGERDGTGANRTAITSLQVFAQAWQAALWPTMTASDQNTEAKGPETRKRSKGRRPRADAAMLWSTPDAQVFADGHFCTPEEWEARRAALKERAGNGNGCGTPLAMQAHLFGSDSTTEASSRSADSVSKDGAPTGSPLWASPTTQDAENDGPPSQAARNSPPLNAQTALWSSPQARDGDGRSPQAKRWGHPARKGGFNLDDQVEAFCLSSLLAPLLSPNGERCSSGAPGSPPPSARRRLNPRFVCWLMGWPTGWTSLAPIGSGSWATEWCRYRAAWRWLCSGLDFTTEGDDGGAT